jgi:hypothetical protein
MSRSSWLDTMISRPSARSSRRRAMIPSALDVVQVGGRLVGEEHRRVGGQAPGHRGALLLAARELAGPVPGALAQPHPLEQLVGARERRLAGDAGQDERHGDVLARR